MAIEKNEDGLYEVKVGEKVYQFEKWNTTDSLKVLTRIAHLIAEPAGLVLGKIAVGSKGDIKKLLDLDIGPDMIAGSVKSLMFNMNDDAIDLVKRISSNGVLCDGAKINFDSHYADELDHLFDVVKAGLEVQYGNFLLALKGRLTAMAPFLKNRTVSTQEKQTSTGTSGRRSSRA